MTICYHSIAITFASRVLLFSSVIVLLCFFACGSNDHEVSNSAPHTPYDKIVIHEEITPSDAQQVHWSQSFYFREGQIGESVIEQRFATNSEEFALEAHEKVSHLEHQVNIADDSGNETSYYLDVYGVASEAKRVEASGQIRTYKLDYQLQDGKRQLISIKEYIDETLFSSLQLDYHSRPGQLIVWHQIGDEYQQELLIDLDKNVGFKAIVPPLFLTEIHPLALHVTAMYGKLLGEAWPHIVRVTPTKGTSGIRNYTYQFTNQGLIESCTETGAGAMRTLNYTFYP